MKKNKIISVVLAIVFVLSMLCLNACGLIDPSTGKSHEINYSEWSKDASGHWHECATCDEKFNFAKHVYRSSTSLYCTVCQYERTLSGGGGEEDPTEDNIGVYSIVFDATLGYFPTGSGTLTLKTKGGYLDDIPDAPKLDAENKFIGWYTGENGSGKKVEIDFKFTENTRVYAHWSGMIREEEEDVVYEITFHADPGSFSDDKASRKVRISGHTLSSMPEAPVLDGKKFEGWFTGQNGEGYQVDTTHVFSEDTDVYAYWTNVVVIPVGVFTITFHAAPGSFSNGSQTTTLQTLNGRLETLPVPPTASGKRFFAWYTQQNGEGSKVTTNHLFNQTSDVYAFWIDDQVEDTNIPGDNLHGEVISDDFILANAASDYGYNWLATQEKSSKKQEFYNKLVAIENKVWAGTAQITNPQQKDDGSYYYTAGQASIENENNGGLTEQEMLNVFDIYLYDHPYIFWEGKMISRGHTATTHFVNLTILGEYADYADLCAERDIINDNIRALYEKASRYTSAYEQSAVYYREVGYNVEYTYDDNGEPAHEYWAHSIVGILDDKTQTGPVCESYARVLQLMFNLSGIDNVYCLGMSGDEGAGGGGGHAWNLVKLDDGNYYYYDLTWDDGKNDETVDFDYFAVPKSKKINNKNYFWESHRVSDPDKSNAYYLYDMPDNIAEASLADSYTNTFAIGSSATKDGTTYVRIGADTVAFCGSKVYTSNMLNIPAVATVRSKRYKVLELGGKAGTGFTCVAAAGQTVVIPATVEAIRYGALKTTGKITIHYNGTKDQWDAMRFSSNAFGSPMPTLKYKGEW